MGKVFKNQSVASESINAKEFGKAVSALGLKAGEGSKLFDNLINESQFKSQDKIGVAEIEELFKAYAAHLKGNTDHTLVQIMVAFNCDITFIEQ